MDGDAAESQFWWSLKANWDFNDRRGWQYSTGGRPVDLTSLMLRLLRGEEPHLEAVPLSGLVTRTSLPYWRAALESDDERKKWRQRNNGIMPLVRHPAQDVAYVFCPLVHPDQTEAVIIERETQVSVDICTLVYDQHIHDWKIHQLGEPASPITLGKAPFPPA